MRAAVFHGTGDIRIEEVPHPGEPAAGEVLLGVHRAAICGTDASEWLHGPRLARPPVVLGHEFAGVVSAVGTGVDGFRPGQRVVSGAGVWCGACDWCRSGRTNLCASYFTLGLTVDGGLAAAVRVPAITLAALPDEVSDDAAALAQPFAVAIHAVRRSGIGADDTVAVIGIGGIGAFIVAAAVARRPHRLVAIDVDSARLATARSLGASEAVDASGRDLAELIRDRTEGHGASVVIEASGAPQAPAAALAATRRGGRVVLVGLQAGPRELDLFDAAVREIDIITSVAHVCGEDLPEAVRLLATSDVADVVIERTIGLDELVAGGIEPLARRRARGKTVVDPQLGASQGRIGSR